MGSHHTCSEAHKARIAEKMRAVWKARRAFRAIEESADAEEGEQRASEVIVIDEPGHHTLADQTKPQSGISATRHAHRKAETNTRECAEWTVVPLSALTQERVLPWQVKTGRHNEGFLWSVYHELVKNPIRHGNQLSNFGRLTGESTYYESVESE